MKPIEKNQLKAIWGQAHKMGLNEESLRQMVAKETGKRSFRSLTQGEAAEILLQLRKKRLEKILRGWKYDEGQDSISVSQIDLIHGLSRENHYDRFRVQRLAQRMYGLRKLEKMNKKQASGLIEALKAIKKRRAA